jgi:N4-gp56 family major capsid protein
MPNTTYGDVNQRTAAYAAKTMLEHAEPQIAVGRYGDSKPLPKNEAKTVKFRRPIPFGANTTELIEGVTPEARRMVYEDVEATMGQYGDIVEITDHVADMSEDPVLRDASVLCGEQIAQTTETLCWGAMKAGTSVFYGALADTVRSDVNDPISQTRQRAATKALRANRAKMVTKVIGGSPNYTTEPVSAGYVGFGHTDLESDCRDMTDFTPYELYGQMKAMPYEAGKCELVRYVLTAELTPIIDAGNSTLNGMVSTGGTNADVYPVVIVGQHAYGTVPLKGANAVSPTVVNPTPSKSDPLGQRGYVGWKMYYVALILNQNWLTRLEVGATDI